MVSTTAEVVGVMQTASSLWARRRVSIASGVLLGARIALGAIFIYSAMAKIRRPYDFLGNVYGFELVGPTAGAFVAGFLPWFELTLGICLIAGIALRAALLGSLLLGILFVSVQVHAIGMGLTIACGCFGASDPVAQPVDYRTLLRASAVLVSAAIGYLLSLSARPDKARV